MPRTPAWAPAEVDLEVVAHVGKVCACSAGGLGLQSLETVALTSWVRWTRQGPSSLGFLQHTDLL